MDLKKTDYGIIYIYGFSENKQKCLKYIFKWCLSNSLEVLGLYIKMTDPTHWLDKYFTAWHFYMTYIHS
jgi:hypothetical protein